MSSFRASQTAVPPRRINVRELAAALGLTALDIIDAIRARRARARNRINPPVVCSIVIDRPPEEVYALYRKLSQLPLFMEHLHTVREADSQWSHWVARLPTRTVAWDVKITDDIPGELLAWRSVKESKIQMRSRVTFTRVERGATQVRVETQLGFAGTRPDPDLARCFSQDQVAGDLRRLKDTLEASEPSRVPVPLPAAPPVAKEVWRFERPQIRIVAP
jgi:uncharacterized membrane protein